MGGTVAAYPRCVLSDQYCVRMRARARVNRRDYALWDLSKRELAALIRFRNSTEFRRMSRGRSRARIGAHHPTAVARKRPPKPLRRLRLTKCDRALYHGVGRDASGMAALRRHCRTVAAFDPHHPDPSTRRRPRGKFDRVFSVYTLNVLSSKQGRQVLKDIHSLLKKNGRALIAVRRDVCR